MSIDAEVTSEVRMTGSRWLFATAVFLGAFLLFMVEPIAAKQLVPVLGGSAAVWITCLVFFQTASLGDLFRTVADRTCRFSRMVHAQSCPRWWIESPSLCGLCGAWQHHRTS